MSSDPLAQGEALTNAGDVVHVQTARALREAVRQHKMRIVIDDDRLGARIEEWIDLANWGPLLTAWIFWALLKSRYSITPEWRYQEISGEAILRPPLQQRQPTSPKRLAF